MLGIFSELGWLATEEEILSFLRLWAWIFVVLFTLRLMQRFGRWRRRRREARLARKAASGR